MNMIKESIRGFDVWKKTVGTAFIAIHIILMNTVHCPHVIIEKKETHISQETGIANVTFNTIADYVILICFMMKAMVRPKSEIMAFIRVFEQNCETFRKNVASSIYMSVIYTDTRAKLKAIKAYI